MKRDTSEKGIAGMSKMFNQVKSVPCVEREIHIDQDKVKADDGYEIPVRIYHSDTPVKNGPILYYIHGGGFMKMLKSLAAAGSIFSWTETVPAVI